MQRRINTSHLIGAPLKMIDSKLYESYLAFSKESFGVLITTITQWFSPTIVRVSGNKSIPKQLFRRADGGLECRFADRMVMMANHQLYTDWLYIWWIAYTNKRHGNIFIVLKDSLKNVPLIGWSAQLYNFIFLSRNWEKDAHQFQSKLDKLSNSQDPMWLLIFPEGTNLASCTREKSQAWAAKNKVQDMKHQLLPRSKGIQLCLKRLNKSVEWLYDCTIAYGGIPQGQYGQDIFTLSGSLLEGKPPESVNMYFRRFRISTIPFTDDKAFEIWLRNRWREKDYLLEHFARYQVFPEDEGWLLRQKRADQARRLSASPAKYIQAELKSKSEEEFLSIFTPLACVLMVAALMMENPQLKEVRPGTKRHWLA